MNKEWQEREREQAVLMRHVVGMRWSAAGKNSHKAIVTENGKYPAFYIPGSIPGNGVQIIG